MWIIALTGYDKTYAERFLALIEKDVISKANKYRVKGMTSEDLAQEFRMRIYVKCHLYNPAKSGFRTWANTVMENHAKNLIRKTTKKGRDILNDKRTVYLGDMLE